MDLQRATVAEIDFAGKMFTVYPTALTETLIKSLILTHCKSLL